MVALNPHETYHDRRAGPAVDLRDMGDGDSLHSVVEHIHGNLHIRAQVAAFRHAFGQAFQAAKGVRRQDAARITHDITVVIVARRPDEDYVQVLHGMVSRRTHWKTSTQSSQVLP